MLKITSGVISRAQKVVIYGSEGIGKTTLAASFPNPLIIDTEGGTAHIDVRRIDKPQSWDELIAVISEVAVTPNICKTLVIDTADWAEQLAVTHVCTKYRQNSIESFGYGKGFTYLAEEFTRLFDALDRVIAAGIHVVVTAHTKMRKFELPDEMGAYDRWEMKLSKQVAPLLKEWCDILLFLNYQTYVVTTESKSQKAQGGRRVMYTSHHPCWDAKNRHGLPDVLDMDYKHIAALFEQKTVSASLAAFTPLGALKVKMLEDNIPEPALLQFAASKGHQEGARTVADYPDSFISGWVLKYWDRIVAAITTNAVGTADTAEAADTANAANTVNTINNINGGITNEQQ